MLKGIAAILTLTTIFVIQGCSAGEVTADQQKAKKAALQKFEDTHKDPNFKERGP